ncbi:hypothetical protein [Croceicoccus hydrothermalis]|uniref:hypothetical protein n=1 Tax=Croceicoccus hydrothermalis TaxID=2867964 RepID=UPI00308449CD
MLRIIMQVFGTALVLVGGLWTLQGLGLVMWPAESFMLGQDSWAVYGGIAMAVGLVLLWLTRRRIPRR